MIGVGLDDHQQRSRILVYAAEHAIERVVVIAPPRFAMSVEGADQVEFSDVIMYRTFYRLLQEIGPRTLLVIHECMRTQTRSDLTYNCIRHFIAQTEHVLVFQARPMIDTIEDFMILVDFATRSRWRRESFSPELLRYVEIVVEPKHYAIDATQVQVDAKTQAIYAKTKRSLIDNLGLGDPHTIPRNLHLIGGKARAIARQPGTNYVARNQRLGLERCSTYAAELFEPPCHVLDFPHRFIDWSDFLTASSQTKVSAIVSDLRVDQWYLERFQAWTQRVNDAQAALLA